MPSNMLTTDTSFPQLTDKQTTDEKFSVITNYLYMLLEQLRYSMANLGRENFNDAEFNSIANIITEPVYLQLKDVDGNLASLTITAEQLISRMTDAEGNISVLQQTADSLTSRISDTEGNVSVLPADRPSPQHADQQRRGGYLQADSDGKWLHPLCQQWRDFLGDPPDVRQRGDFQPNNPDEWACDLYWTGQRHYYHQRLLYQDRTH